MHKLKISYILLLTALLLSLCAITSCGGDSGGNGGDINQIENEQCTITFVADNGMQLGVSVVTKGGVVKYPTPPTIPGMHFVGWSTYISTATEDMTITAMYEPDEAIIGGDEGEMLEVRFYDIYNRVFAIEYVQKGKDVSNIPTLPYVDGKTFVGWDNSCTNVEQDMDVYPIYEDAKRYEVSFYDYDGRWIETKTVDENASVEPPEISRYGYSIVGWTEDLSSVTSSMRVYPIYELNDISNALDISNKINADGTCTLTVSVKGNVCFAGAQGKITFKSNIAIEDIALGEGCATRVEENVISFVFTSVSGENITQDTDLMTLTVRCTDNSYFSIVGISIEMVFDRDFNSVGFGAVLGSTFYTCVSPE